MKTEAALVTLVLTAAVWINSALAVINFETAPGGGPVSDDGAVLGPYTDSGVQVFFGFEIDSNGRIDAISTSRRAS